jgi:hypothetical protein
MADDHVVFCAQSGRRFVHGCLRGVERVLYQILQLLHHGGLTYRIGDEAVGIVKCIEDPNDTEMLSVSGIILVLDAGIGEGYLVSGAGESVGQCYEGKDIALASPGLNSDFHVIVLIGAAKQSGWCLSTRPILINASHLLQ